VDCQPDALGPSHQYRSWFAYSPFPSLELEISLAEAFPFPISIILKRSY
jgi:hypothetical protein